MDRIIRNYNKIIEAFSPLTKQTEILQSLIKTAELNKIGIYSKEIG